MQHRPWTKSVSNNKWASLFTSFSGLQAAPLTLWNETSPDCSKTNKKQTDAGKQKNSMYLHGGATEGLNICIRLGEGHPPLLSPSPVSQSNDTSGGLWSSLTISEPVIIPHFRGWSLQPVICDLALTLSANVGWGGLRHGLGHPT